MTCPTYAKIFRSMYTGSMYGAGLHVFAVWGWVLANKDENGGVEINPTLVAHQLGGPVDQVESAIEYLTQADPSSRTPEENGRRLIKVSQFGYRVVNHDRYRRLGGSRREYWREWRNGQKPVAQRCAQHGATHTDTNTDADTLDTPNGVSSSEAVVSEDAIRLARLLRDLIVARLPKSRASRAKLDVWGKHIDKLIRIDGRTVDEIEAVVRFSQADPFWCSNILSTAKLRAKFDTLESRMQKDTSNGHGRKFDRDYQDRPSDFGDEVVV